jgi:hypothetical protein
VAGTESFASYAAIRVNRRATRQYISPRTDTNTTTPPPTLPALHSMQWPPVYGCDRRHNMIIGRATRYIQLSVLTSTENVKAVGPPFPTIQWHEFMPHRCHRPLSISSVSVLVRAITRAVSPGYRLGLWYQRGLRHRCGRPIRSSSTKRHTVDVTSRLHVITVLIFISYVWRMTLRREDGCR